MSVQHVQMTAAFAGGKAGAMQKSFAERWLLPYALIAAYGVGNEVAARTTGASDEDLAVMLEALWSGTNDLATTSKMGHSSLLLVDVRSAPGRRIGRLDRRVSLRSEIADEHLRSADEFDVDVSGLIRALVDAGAAVKAVFIKQDGRLRTRAGEATGLVAELLQQAGVPARSLP